MERVLNITQASQHKLYPFSVLKKEAVVNDTIGDVQVVVFSRDGTRSALDRSKIAKSRIVPSATAFARKIGNQTLKFWLSNGKLLDRQTGSQWNFLGQATAGPLSGTQLTRLDSEVHFAFAWFAFKPQSAIYGR